jgi:hypothetical protein
MQHPQLTPELTPESMAPLPGTPPASTGKSSGAQSLKIINLQAGYVFSHTSLPCAESFTLDIFAQDNGQDADFDPDLLSDAGTSTG